MASEPPRRAGAAQEWAARQPGRGWARRGRQAMRVSVQICVAWRSEAFLHLYWHGVQNGFYVWVIRWIVFLKRYSTMWNLFWVWVSLMQTVLAKLFRSLCRLEFDYLHLVCWHINVFYDMITFIRKERNSCMIISTLYEL